MGKIKVMDEQLSNMIAAGEVVERPASVVKELVENAIDAGANRIEIEISEGGLNLIRIIDNGHGMGRDDCLQAFERHATSKIATTRDLFHIRTLGFRGEALASIASVSKIELLSSEASGQVGTQVSIVGGQVKQVIDVATVKGTDILVKDLFYNTPARLKYMKSISTEIGHISDFINRLALANPTISFKLSHNQKTLLQTAGDGKLLHTMAAIYGTQVAKYLLPISGESLDFRWNGYLSKTEVTRANRSYISTIVNGRYIRSYPLSNAVLRGYHTLLPTGRYPLVALHVEMDPTLIDVNVHPAKLEVRFSKERELIEAIEQSVRTTLREGLNFYQPQLASRQPGTIKPAAYQPSLRLDGASRGSGSPLPYQPPANGSVQVSGARIRESLYAPVEQLKDKRAPQLEQNYRLNAAAVELTNEELTRDHFSQEKIPAKVELTNNILVNQKRSNEERLEKEPANERAIELDSQKMVGDVTETSTPTLYPVGQVHGTYIVAQNETGMFLIDQHAAQERIFYEYFMDKLKEEQSSSQLLLFSHTIECTTSEYEKVLHHLSLLQSVGLEIEPFGQRTFIVRAHPHWFPEGSELELINELVQFVIEQDDQAIVDMVKMREKAAIMMSCKASIKANRFLTQAEMEALLERLRATTSPFTCPHGRPIIIHFSSYDLEKMFKRVM